LTKKQKVNEGEVPQYYVENSHPAIISSDVFDMVQEERSKGKT
jgi:site-specific DNA recombinase